MSIASQILRLLSLPMALAAFIVAAQISGGLEFRTMTNVQVALK